MMLSRKTITRLAIAGLFTIIFFSQIKAVGGKTVSGDVSGQDYLAKGDKAVVQGRSSYDVAVKHFTAAIGKLPQEQLWKAYYKRAEVYQLQKRYEEALKDLDEWVRLKPNKSSFTSRIKVNVLLANFDTVAQDYQQLMQVDSKKAADHRAKWELYSRLSNQIQWVKEQVERLASGTAEDHHRPSIYSQCVSLLGEILQDHSKGNQDLALMRIECALGMGDHNLVRNEVNKMLEKNPNNLKALYFKAKSFIRMGAVDAARTHIRKCFSVDQEYDLCVQLHKQIKAYEKQKKVVQDQQNNRNWQGALDAIDEAFRIDPEGPETNNFRKLRCQLYNNLRMIKEGLQACTTCIEAEGENPGLLDVYLTRADIHILNDDLDSAQADVNKAREFDQRSQKVHQKQQNLERLRKLAERKDYYKILGVPKTASDKDIKSAYRKLAMQYHPDKTQSLPEEEREKAQALFRDIAEAKDILSDDEKRGKYDRGEDLNEQQHHGHHPHHHFHHPGGQHFEFRFG